MTLPARRSGAIPTPHLTGGNVYTRRVSTEERISFTNPRGQRLCGVVHHPDRQPRGAVVVAHGMLSSKESSKHRDVCERSSERGLLALRFDFAGRGQSDGELGELTVSNQVADLVAAVRQVRTITGAPLALVGSSLGGAVAVLTAAADAGVTTLVTMAAPARLPRAPRPQWREPAATGNGERVQVAPGAAVGPGFFHDAARHGVLAAAARIGCPWLILHGGQDEVVAVDDAHDLLSASPAGELLVHPDADHRFARDAHRRWLIERVVAFLDRHLIPSSPSSSAPAVVRREAGDG
jgi:alpha-beta hydrolase superfamily lysophospholipase